MRTLLKSTIQKCICIDSVINNLNTSNTLYFSHHKTELKYLLHSTVNYLNLIHKDTFNVEVNLMTKSNNCKHLINTNSFVDSIHDVISSLDILCTYNIDVKYLRIIKNLINSYHSLIINFKKTNNINKDVNHQSLDSLIYTDHHSLEFNFDIYKDICLNAINHIFDFDTFNQPILNENFEYFLDVNTNKYFYQFFFKYKDRVFKLRLSDDAKLYYAYQFINTDIEVVPVLSEEDCLSALNKFLKNKFKDICDMISLDKNYNKTYNDMNYVLEYSFKYNLPTNESIYKSIYFLVNPKYFYIQEIYLK